MPTVGANLNLVTVTADALMFGGPNAGGLITFTPQLDLGALIDSNANQIFYPQTFTGKFTTAGLLKQLDGVTALSMPCTDDADLLPVDWSYHVVEDITNRSGPNREYDIHLALALGATQDLADIAPVGVVSVSSAFASEGELVALANRVAALEGAMVASGGEPITFSKAGTVAVATGKGPYRVPAAVTVDYVLSSVGTAPVGASLIVDVKKNGTTIFTTGANRPAIAAGTKTVKSVAPDITNLAAGDIVTVDVIQVGSTTPGADLTVEVVFH